MRLGRFSWRRKYLICGFQYRLVAGSFLYMVAIVLIFLAAVFRPLIGTLEHGGAQSEAARLLLAFNETVWVALPIMLAICATHSVLLSHRVAGPLHRFKREFRTLGRGDFSRRVSIRASDYLTEEVEAMGVASRVRDIRTEHREAAKTLEDLSRALGRGTPGEAAVIAGKLGTQLDLLGHRIRQIRLPGDDPAGAGAPALRPAETTRT
jgi:hypothetical protein